MSTPITSLTGNDTFQTLFNTTNSLIVAVNAGICGGSLSTGISGGYVAAFNGLTGVVTFSNYVSSFNGLTGAVAGVTGIRSGNSGITITGTTNPVIVNAGVLSVNGSVGAVENIARLDTTQIFTTLQQYTAGISASGATFNGDVTITGNLIAPGFNPNSVSGVASFNGLTGAVTGVTTSVANVFTPVQTFNAGLSAAGATLNGNLTVNATSVFNGNVTITGSLTASIPTVTNVVSSLNGLTGNLTGVASFNGLTGAVTGVTTSVANVFTPVQTFNAGLSAAGATFGADIRVNTITVGRGVNPNNSTAVGLDVLRSNTDGNDNTGVGHSVLSSNTSGNYNTGIGSGALATNENGEDNTAIGASSLLQNTNGNHNTAVGYNSLSSNLSGNYNTALGSAALEYNTATGNLGIGYRALTNAVSGNYNTAVGTEAGKDIADASKSVLLGYNTRVNNGSSSNNEIVIGADAVGLGSNTAVIGSTLINQTKINGIILGEKGLSLTSCGISLSGAYNTVIDLFKIKGSTFGGFGLPTGGTYGGLSYSSIDLINNLTDDINDNNRSPFRFGVFGTSITPVSVVNNVLGYNVSDKINLGFGQGVFGTTLTANESRQSIGIGNNIASKGRLHYCTAVGHQALNGMTSTITSDCVMVGYLAGSKIKDNGTFTSNVGVGNYSFYEAFNCSNNTAIGSNNMTGLSTGTYNVTVGSSNFGYAINVNKSIGIGNNTLVSAINTNDNIAIGESVLGFITDGNGNNIGLGSNVLRDAIFSENNIVLGGDALSFALNSSENTALGYQAAYLSGDQNAVEGCTSSVFIGSYTKPATTGGFNEIVIGYDAVGNGSNTTVMGNTYTTSTTLRGVLSVPGGITGVTFTKDITVNSARVGIGAGNLTSNAALGVGALNANTTGTHNVAVGSGSLLVNTTSADNTGVGFNALTANTSGIENSAFGSGALSSNVGGQDNTAVGFNTLTSNTSGSSNVAVGTQALQSNTTGSNNTGIGHDAGRYFGSGTALTSVTGGVFVGYNTRASANSQTNEIVIGTNAIGLGSNTAVLGATLQQSATIYGQLRLPSGLSASGATFAGSVVSGGTFSFGRVMDTTENNRVIMNAFKIVSKTGLSAEVARFNKNYYNMVDVTSTVNIIDQNNTQGVWPSGIGLEPSPVPNGYYIGRKDLIVHDGVSSDGTDRQTYVTAINLTAHPTSLTWDIGCNINGNDAILYITPYTRQTAIFTGHYTLTPVGLTG